MNLIGFDSKANKSLSDLLALLSVRCVAPLRTFEFLEVPLLSCTSLSRVRLCQCFHLGECFDKSIVNSKNSFKEGLDDFNFSQALNGEKLSNLGEKNE